MLIPKFKLGQKVYAVRRTITEFNDYKYEISYNEATIGKVETHEYAPKYEYKSVVEYMLEESGVGSGQVWKEERLFATEDEAKEFCNKYVPYDYYDTKAILKDLEKENLQDD